MLPPSPGNTLLPFLHDVLRGDLDPALCSTAPKIDPQRYWEMRRVQNSVRRLLECLQDLLRLDAGTSAAEVACAVWGALFGEQRSVDEQALLTVLDHAGAWPPEMSSADRLEVFAALRVPSAATLRALATGQPLAPQLSRRMFCEALSRIPFNIPDFPVPTHLYDPALVGLAVEQVAAMVAAAFSREVRGIDRAKDYYLTGLLSLEQVQAALPCVVKDSIVEQAVTQVIRVGTSMFSSHEWHSLVLAIRLAPLDPCETAGDLERAQRQQDRQQLLQRQHELEQQQRLQRLIFKEQQLAVQERRVAMLIPPSPSRDVHRDALIAGSPLLQSRQVDYAGGASAAAVPGGPRTFGPAAGPAGEDSPQRQRPRRQTAPSQSPTSGVPMTEPLPHRSVRAEEPVVFTDTFSRSGKLSHIIDWKSTRPAAEGASAGDALSATTATGSPEREVDVSAQTDLGHQPDEGAGPRTAALEGQPPEDAAAAAGEPEGGSADDAVRFISLDMHNECLGPFLALAFARCCQLYEARLSDVEAEAQAQAAA